MQPHPQRVRLLIVDDNADLADLLALTLRAIPGFDVVGVLASADSLLDTIARDQPSVVLIDLGMQGKPTLEAVREASTQFPDTRCIIYSGYDDPDTIDRAVDAGAWGFVSKHREIDVVADTIRRVAAGELALQRS